MQLSELRQNLKIVKNEQQRRHLFFLCGNQRSFYQHIRKKTRHKSRRTIVGNRINRLYARLFPHVGQNQVAGRSSFPNRIFAKNHQRFKHHGKNHLPLFFSQIIQMLHNLVGARMITEKRRFPDKAAEHGFPASVSTAGFFLSDGIIAFDQTVDHHCKAKFLSLPGRRNIFPAADRKIVVDCQPVVLQIVNRRRGIFLRHQGIIAEQNILVFRTQFAVIQKFSEEIIVGGCLFRLRNVELQQPL